MTTERLTAAQYDVVAAIAAAEGRGQPYVPAPDVLPRTLASLRRRGLILIGRIDRRRGLTYKLTARARRTLREVGL